MKEELDLTLEGAYSINAPNNELCYHFGFDINEGRFQGDGMISIITLNREVAPETFSLIREVYENIETVLVDGLTYMIEQLKADPVKYNILDKEMEYLDLPVEAFPIDDFALNFNSGDVRWAIIFVSRKLDISDPNGILVYFEGKQPVEVEDISNLDGFNPDYDE